MHHLPTSFREKLFNFSRKDVSRKKYFTYRRLSGQFFLSMQDIGRIKSIAEDNLMFVYERFCDKLTPNPPRGDPLSSWQWKKKKGKPHKEVASNRLKIGQQVAHRQAVIAHRGISARQNSYGFQSDLRLKKILPTSFGDFLLIEEYYRHELTRGGLGGRSPPNVDPLSAWLN